MADADDSRDWVAPVAALQTDVGNLRQEVHSIARSIKELGDGVYSALDKVRSSQPGSYSLPVIIAFVGGVFIFMIAAAGLILGLCGAIGTLALQPFRERQFAQEERIDRIQISINDVARQNAANAVQFTEVETQFRTARELEDLRFEMGMKEVEHIREMLNIKSGWTKADK